MSSTVKHVAGPPAKFLNVVPRTTMSWRATFAGVVVALAVQMVLATLGLAIGATAVGTSTDVETTQRADMGVWIGSLVSSVLSIFCGGVVAGFSARVTSKGIGAIEGLVVWGTSVLLFLFFSAGGLRPLIARATRAMIAVSPPGAVPRGFDLPPPSVESIVSATIAAAWIAFATLVLSGIAGMLGGIIGARASVRRRVALETGARERRGVRATEAEPEEASAPTTLQPSEA